jgi:hypothetical protein
VRKQQREGCDAMMRGMKAEDIRVSCRTRRPRCCQLHMLPALSHTPSSTNAHQSTGSEGIQSLR